MKKFLPLALAFLIVIALTCPAYAVDTNALSSHSYVSDGTEYYTFTISGEGTFLLSQAQNRIIGVKEPDEDVPTLKMQFAKSTTSPGGIVSSGVHRIKAYTNVRLDESNQVSRGGITLSCTLRVIHEDLLREAMKIADEDVITVAKVIDRTIYCPNISAPNPVAAHMFMTSDSDRIHVADLIFSNDVILPVYSADWDWDNQIELGFAPSAVKNNSNGNNNDDDDDDDGDDNHSDPMPNPHLRP